MSPFDLALAPFEWLRGGVVGGDERVDGLTQFGDAAEAGAAEGLSGHNPKPDFNLIEPARRSRGEVEVHVGVLCEPVVAFFVGAVVVEDHVQFAFWRSVCRDLIHELQELCAALERRLARCDRAGRNLQRCEQKGRQGLASLQTTFFMQVGQFTSRTRVFIAFLPVQLMPPQGVCSVRPWRGQLNPVPAESRR